MLPTAIKATFAARQTAMPRELPLALTDEFAGNPLIISRWNAFIRRNRITSETDLTALIENLREFFTPLVEAEKQNVVFTKSWANERKWRK